MELSIFLFGLDLHEYTPLIEAAEDSGYSAVWLGDHLIAPEVSSSPNPYGPSGQAGLNQQTPFADVWTVMAYAARSTSTIHLATGVYILPLRNVMVSARSAASVQSLSGGRLLFGIGTGWLREEFDAVHESFAERAVRTDETIDALRLLWTGRPVSYSGRHVSFPDVRLAPPVEVPIPIFAGGLSSEALERAALLCDGWFGPACTLERSVIARQKIEAYRSRHGRTTPFKYVVRPDGQVDEAMIARYRGEGFDHLTLSLKQVGLDGRTTLEERIAALRAAPTRLGVTVRGPAVAL